MLRVVTEAAGAHRLAESRVDLRVGERHRKRKHVGRPAQPPHVTLEQERLAVVRAQRFIDAFAVQKSVIEHRDDGVFLIADAPVDVDDGCHRREA